MRPIRACLQCRLGKRKCERRINRACSQCVSRSLPCSDAVAVGNGDRSPRALPATLSTREGEEITYLLELYFQYYHDQPHSLFHEATFKQDAASNLVPKQVLYAMMGISARFAPQPDVRARGVEYAEKAKKLLKDDMERICLENIQASILIGNICFGDCAADVESLYFGSWLHIVRHSGELLARDLHDVVQPAYIPTDDGITKELKTRIFWTCFIIDTWASGGSALSRQFHKQAIAPRIPMDEVVFKSMRRGDPYVEDKDWRPGLWGHMVTLVDIYARIQRLHEDLASQEVWNELHTEEAVCQLDRELADFESRLGPRLLFTLDNFKAYIDLGIGAVFIAFHLGYHHYCTLLFYQYLDQRRPVTRNGTLYRNRCKAHAAVVCDILKASRTEGVGGLYNIVGHVAIVSSSVLLHTYLFGEARELDEVKERLESNLESLVQLRSYWASIELMINRLVVFQKHCILSISKNTHRFDHWMVKFLIAHSMALEDKEESPHSASTRTDPIEELATTPGERSRVTQSLILGLQNNETGWR